MSPFYLKRKKRRRTLSSEKFKAIPPKRLRLFYKLCVLAGVVERNRTDRLNIHLKGISLDWLIGCSPGTSTMAVS